MVKLPKKITAQRRISLKIAIRQSKQSRCGEIRIGFVLVIFSVIFNITKKIRKRRVRSGGGVNVARSLEVRQKALKKGRNGGFRRFIQF